MERKKILFFAEAVTLAHVGRALTLAASLDPAKFDIHFACADGFDFCFTNTNYTRWSVASIPGAQFLDALAKGKPVYDAATLGRYVEEDLVLLRKIQPDVVVGDFRISLSVSARIANIAYISLTNAYWSPHVRQTYAVPDLPLTKFLPLAIANALFSTVRPLAFAGHTRPLNQIRRKHGLPSLGFDLRRIYTDADYTIYADIPELFPPAALPDSHAFFGPILWSPPIKVPHWWDQLSTERPLVYVTLGSSGQGRLLPLVLEALSDLPVTVIAATAGNITLTSVPNNAHVADYLPGELAAARAALVICNGGSPTSHQALAAGVPVLGIPSNLDQFLNMSGIVQAGAGRLVRSDRFSTSRVRQEAQHLLQDPAAGAAAQRIGAAFSRHQQANTLSDVIATVLR